MKRKTKEELEALGAFNEPQSKGKCSEEEMFECAICGELFDPDGNEPCPYNDNNTDTPCITK